MGFGIYSLIEAGVLLINALAILNEERFLSKSEIQYPLLYQAIRIPFLSTMNCLSAEERGIPVIGE